LSCFALSLKSQQRTGPLRQLLQDIYVFAFQQEQATGAMRYWNRIAINVQEVGGRIFLFKNRKI
jgi:hypothetical protein